MYLEESYWKRGKTIGNIEVFNDTYFGNNGLSSTKLANMMEILPKGEWMNVQEFLWSCNFVTCGHMGCEWSWTLKP